MNFLTCLNLSQIESRIKDLSGFKEVLLLAFGNKESIQSLRLGEFHMEKCWRKNCNDARGRKQMMEGNKKKKRGKEKRNEIK